MKKWIIVGTLSLLTSLCFSSKLPNFNSAAQNTFSSIEEEQIGKLFYADVRQRYPLIQDVFVNQYVKELGQHLIAYSPKPKQRAVFFVIRDTDINAFAGPGGYIGINSGTILAAKTRGQLASVMAHELAHVEQRHIARGIEQSKTDQIVGIAAILASIATGSIGAAAAGGAGTFESGMHTSRSFEQEADRIGLEILQKAGFKKSDMAAFLQNLAQNKRRTGLEEFEEIFSSHPSGNNRLAEVSNFRGKQQTQTATLDYQLIQARALVDSSPRSRTLVRKLKKSLGSDPKAISLQYAYALSLIDTDKAKKALSLLQKLSTRFPDNVLINAAKAEGLFASGQRRQALKFLGEELEYQPDNIALALFYSHLLISNKQYAKAVKILRPFAYELKNSANFLSIYSHAQGKSGNKVKGYILRAKFFALLGIYSSAILQLQQALRFDKKGNYKFQINRLLKYYKTERKQYK